MQLKIALKASSAYKIYGNVETPTIFNLLKRTVGEKRIHLNLREFIFLIRFVLKSYLIQNILIFTSTIDIPYELKHFQPVCFKSKRDLNV